jgi:hypothetical protein
MAYLTVKEVADLFGHKCNDSIYDDVQRGIYPPGVVFRVGRILQKER